MNGSDEITREPELIAAERALVKTEHGSPLPIFTGAEMAQALNAYRDLQRALDASMPDQIMDLDGKPFRKKGYWRAIAVAFKLTVEPTEERRESTTTFDDGRDNFGYIVTYRATAPNGRSATGDGSCFAVEKARRFRCPHPEKPGSKRTLHFPAEACPDFDPAFQWKTLPAQATEHNIRSHAHTRAFNRAVSNLVGFGEVSAEEVDRDHDGGSASAVADPVPTEPAPEGYHHLVGYHVNGQWHEAKLLKWDTQGGALKVSTKFQNLANLMQKASNDAIPVKAEVTVKAGRRGEAYLNKLDLYKAEPSDAQIDAEIAAKDQAAKAGKIF